MRRYVCYFLSLFLLFFNCGLKGSDFFETLNVPLGLTLSSPREINKITISFWAYNPETNFTGYNVYMSKISENDVRTSVLNHIVNGVIDTNVEKNKIVQNKESKNYPTIIPSSDSAFLSSPTLVNYVIEKEPDNQNLTLNDTYYIGVTAFNGKERVESKVSNIIKVDPF